MAGVALTLTGSVFLTAGATPPPAADCTGTRWAGSWMAAPSDSFGIVDASIRPQLPVSDQTYRLIITPHRGGSVLRVHLTNRTRPVPVDLAHVTVALQAAGAAVHPDSLREVTFDGNPGVTIGAWRDVVSDPVELPFAAWQPLAVSVYAPGQAVLPTEHFTAMATSYYSPPFAGDAAADPQGAQLSLATTTAPFVSGIDVLAPAEVATVVAFGDSITDGYVAGTALGIPQEPSVVDRNVRYPDFLQRRFDAAGLPFTVLNAGISGNRIGRDGFVPWFADAAVRRVQQDVIDQAAVTDVIILEGINDLGIPIGASFEEVVAGLTALIDRLHAAGLRVHLATILPSSNALANGVLTLPNANATRVRVNAWIRAQQLSDTVVDLDAALRYPAYPDVLDPRYAGPDWVHPNAAGYQAMADAIDLGIFHGLCR